MVAEHGTSLTDVDLRHLRRCVELAEQALTAGDEPFGSVLADCEGTPLAEGCNRVVETGDATQHPELELARWAAAHLAAEQRPQCTVYTSGEHCPMCAAAHGWVGLGRIVYVTSSQQLAAWVAEAGIAAAPIAPLPIQQVAPHVVVQGPVDELVDDVRRLQLRFHGRDPA
jgi:tRNA(Arg) A34 adenosine deaminase TadA